VRLGAWKVQLLQAHPRNVERLHSKWPGRGMARHVLGHAMRTAWSAVPPRCSSRRVRVSADVRMTMLWTLFVVLLLLWLLGVVSAYTLGGFIHLLLVLAVVAVLVQLITGRRTV
jgi:Family of unknown function (DUF5670)